METEEVVNDLLSGGAYFNFPKMHLISHFTDQISKYGTLPQYSTEICEGLHKPLKDAYRRSNHIDTLPQIISTYARGHSFAMREKNLEQWCSELGHIPEDIRHVVDPTRNRTRTPAGSSPSNLTVKLLCHIDNGAIYNLKTLATYYSLPYLQMLTSPYLNSSDFKSSPDLTSEVAELINAPLETFRTLQVKVEAFDHDGQVIHNLRCTGLDLFRIQQIRHDWVFVRRRRSGRSQALGSLDGRIPGQLNALFKLRDIRAKTTYQLAHVSDLRVVSSPTPRGPDGMVCFGTPNKNLVMCIADSEGMAHLVPIEPDKLYLLNNRIDINTWNDIHDGN